MDYTQLGRSGLKVSRLCLGTVNFGWLTKEDDSHTIMSQALDAGINFFDTSNTYNNGLTEEIIGRWLAEDPTRREKVILATKVYGDMGGWPNQSRLSARHIKEACEASLKRLGVDHIDLYQMHHIDRLTPWEEIWQAMEQLIREGKIIYVGSSNFAGWHIAQANESAKRRHLLGLVSEQSLYSLADRTIELEVIPACQHYGVGLVPYSPLSGGILGGALKKLDDGRRAREKVREEVEKNREQLEAWESFCAKLGQPPADVALAWVLHQPGITAPIIGPRTLDQLKGNLNALTITLDEAALARLDEIWPGPGGQAPEAYAW